MIQTTNRFMGAALAAASVTAALFWAMTALIRVGETENSPTLPISVVLDVYVEPAEQIIKTIRKPPVRQPITEPEPLPPLKGGSTGPGITLAKIVGPGPIFGTDPGNGILTNPDGDAVPLVRVPPQYPARAMARGLEGRVLIEFTISRVGIVEDARVVAFEPTSVFNKAALEAVKQWRYEPKRVNGKTVAQRGKQIVIPFQKGDHLE